MHEFGIYYNQGLFIAYNMHIEYVWINWMKNNQYYLPIYCAIYC